MDTGASSSNPSPPAIVPPPEEGSGSSSALLAPGFRFHPTDEELVRYYLKRKIFGRPLRVDAIAEVELYKAEPWDLPAMSRLRSRDMEWYFFSPLDRKYSNRSRTNRATAQGYWKTTGKDRPVGHGPRVVGMKKTLVFHVGRAPRGERTNWVMHEYRLEDDEITGAGIAQDAYVVCRIFQKSGTGPQNGAQYGAPYVEEEWEECDNVVMAVVDGRDSGDGDNMSMGTVPGGTPILVGTGDEVFLQLADFENNQDHGNQQENTGSDGENNSSYSEDPIFLVEGTFQGNSSDDMKMAGPLDSQICSNGTGRNSHLTGQIQTLPSDNSESVELSDVLEMVNAEYPSSEDSVGCFFGAFKGQNSANQGGVSYCSEICRTEVFNTVNETEYHGQFQTYPTQDDLFLKSNDLVNPIADDYPLEGNMTFYDASSDDHPLQENFVQMHNLYSPVADSSGLNLDDIMCYFDCLDDTDTLQFSTLESSEKLCADSSSNESFAAGVNGSSAPTQEAYTEVLEANVGASSNSLKESVSMPPGSPKEDVGNMTFPKRLANMLGSISAPPAYAAGPPATKGKSIEFSAPTSTSSIHVTAGVIQIHGFNMMGRTEHWSSHKSGDFGFLLSFGVARNVLGKSEGFEPVTKMQGWTMSVVLRGGFYFFLLSILFVALSFKVGMLVFSR